MKSLARSEDLAEIVRRLRTVRPDNAARWGRMSAHQMVCHLADALSVATGQTIVGDVSRPWLRTIVKWIALYLPLPWPSGIATVPEIDQEIGGTRPQDFASDLTRVESLLMRLADRPDTVRHPIFGPMSKPAWLRWGYLHTDHHLRQFGV